MFALSFEIGRAKFRTEKDEGKPKRSLKEAAMNNPTALGDPVSLKAETSDTEPTENDRGALRDGKKRDSKL